MQTAFARVRSIEPLARFELVLSAVLMAVLLAGYLGVAPAPGGVPLVLVAAVLGVVPVVYGALRQLIEREWASMEMLAAIALGFSLYAAEWESAVFIALMLSGSRLLSVITESRARTSVESLLSLRPDTARVERGAQIALVPLAQVAVGDVVVVDAGDRVPVDGTVLRGEGAADESSLTGESLPVDKQSGSLVYSGTLLTSGGIRLTAEKVGQDTALEKIIKLVESSQANRSRIVTIGERFGRIYLIGMIVIAAGIMALTHNTSLVLALVLVVCADDIAIAVPLAFLGAIGTAAKHGIIVKGGAHLEGLGRVGTFIFDKTGTLTTGTLTVVAVRAVDGTSEAEVLRYAAIAARGSQHPLSRAIVAHAAEAAGAFPTLSRSVGGKGVVATHEGATIVLGRASFVTDEGATIPPALVHEIDALGDEGNSVSVVACDGVVLGAIALCDEIKPEARAALAELRALGATQLVMLTGDNERVAHTVCTELGIDTYYAGLLPEDKVAKVAELSRAGEVVMVGDGINDAAALASATVGIAMGGIGHDVTIESADVVLMTDDLGKLVDAVRIARVTKQIALEDFWIWGVTNGVGIALVFGGLIGPAGAAAYNFISDFFPLGNSLRAWAMQRRI